MSCFRLIKKSLKIPKQLKRSVYEATEINNIIQIKTFFSSNRFQLILILHSTGFFKGRTKKHSVKKFIGDIKLIKDDTTDYFNSVELTFCSVKNERTYGLRKRRIIFRIRLTDASISLLQAVGVTRGGTGRQTEQAGHQNNAKHLKI